MGEYRRKSLRFAVRPGCIAILDKSGSVTPENSHPLTLGSVMDISAGGVAVQYIKKNKKKINKKFKINIQVDYVDMAITSLPVTKVRDFEIGRKQSSYSVRKLCLQFGVLSEKQKALLKDFIKTNTTGLSQDRRSDDDRRKYIDPEYSNPECKNKIDLRTGRDRRRLICPPPPITLRFDPA